LQSRPRIRCTTSRDRATPWSPSLTGSMFQSKTCDAGTIFHRAPSSRIARSKSHSRFISRLRPMCDPGNRMLEPARRQRARQPRAGRQDLRPRSPRRKRLRRSLSRRRRLQPGEAVRRIEDAKLPHSLPRQKDCLLSLAHSCMMLLESVP